MFEARDRRWIFEVGQYRKGIFEADMKNGSICRIEREYLKLMNGVFEADEWSI